MKIRKVLETGVLLLTLVFVLGACGAKESSKDNEDKNKTITIWSNFQTELDILKKAAKSYENETGVKVKVINATSELQKLSQAENSPSGPDGIFGVSNDQFASYVAAGLVDPISDKLFPDKDYVSSANQSVYYKGKKYGMPISVETTTLFYNTDKVSSAPKDWETLISEATNKGGIQFEATSIYYDYGFLRAFGGYIFKTKKDTVDVKDIGLNTAGAIKGYQYIEKLGNKYNFFDSTVTNDIAKGNFQDGKTAFFIGGPWDIDSLRKAGTPFKVAIMPKLNEKKFITPVGTQIGFVSPKSQNKDDVWSFYKYVIKNDAKAMFDKGARIPAKLSAQREIDFDDDTTALVDQINNSEPLPSVPELSQIWTPFQDNVKLLLQKKQNSTVTAKNVSEQFKEAISSMGSGD